MDLILDCVGARYLDANLHSLRSDGVAQVLAGKTTLEEVLRVTREA